MINVENNPRKIVNSDKVRKSLKNSYLTEFMTLKNQKIILMKFQYVLKSQMNWPVLILYKKYMSI